MEMISIQGFEFPRHPPSTSRPGCPTRRLRSIVSSLEFARSQLTPSDRALWLELCRTEAKVRTLLRQAEAATAVEGDGPAWFQRESEPLIS
jgi:hypothetical protein